MTDRQGTIRVLRRLFWGWPAALLVAAWLLAPLRSRSLYPGLACTAGAATFLERASYALVFLPTALLALLLTVGARRAYRQGRRGWALAFGGLAVAAAALFLVFGALPAQRQTEHPVACPPGGRAVEPLRCWTTSARPAVFEMNAFGTRPTDLASLQALARELQAGKQDAFLYEAFLLDTRDSAIAGYSNGRVFTLQRSDLSVFGSVCLDERRAHMEEVVHHRIGFYRFSAQQSPPVDAFFLQDAGPDGERQFEVLDFLHGATLPFVRPGDLQPEESSYLDRVAASLQTLNDDLDREQLSNPPPGALARMRADFERITGELAQRVPPRLVSYRDSRLKRYLQNFELILIAEEGAGAGGTAQIHSSAYEQHRRFYFQEPRVTRLIGYLYLQEPGGAFSDAELSAVNWAVF